MTGQIRTLCVAGVTALVAAAPRAAVACSVCMTGREDDTLLAFRLTTVFLTLLPLVGVGSFVWWLRRRARQLGEGGGVSAEVETGAGGARSSIPRT